MGVTAHEHIIQMQIHPAPCQTLIQVQKNETDKSNQMVNSRRKWRQKTLLYEIENGGEIIKAMQDVPQKY